MYEEIAYIDDPDTPQIEGTPSGTVVHGYDNFGFTQAQFTFLQFVDRILGASRMTFLTEVGFNWINGLPDRSERRYGRSPVYGMGDFAGFTETRDINVGPISAEAEVSYSCESVVLSSDNSIIDGAAGGEVGKPNINPKNCTDEGYYTDFSWGIRSLIALDYNNVFNGINLRPIVVYQKDIEGYAPTPNFNEGTLVMSYKLDATYLNRYTANISYTDYKGGRYNQSVDRDFVAVSVGVSF
jgi:hypothetical protein